jgi:sugar lactone lactonase YvrE
VSHVITALRPGWAVPGGSVSLEGSHLPVPSDGPPHVLVGADDAHVAVASHRLLRFVVPAGAEGGTLAVRIDELPGETTYLQVGRVLVTGVHQVDNPVYGHDGALYCTHSGGRGAKSPVPLYRVGRDGSREPIAVDIANPTSLAIGPDGHLYVSSRFEGIVYRVVGDQAETFASELGTATGLVFGRDGSLYVGDRSGTIFRVSQDRRVETFATIPSSVAAFHLAMGPDDALYVTAPTLATHDALYRITPDRLVDVVYTGLGRPQGLAFDSTGQLYVVEALAGAAGLYRLDVTASRPEAELVLSASSLVGLAFDPEGGIALASGETVWRLDCALKPPGV